MTMPIHEPTNLRTLAKHVRELTTLTQDQTAIDTLIDCAADLWLRASQLAQDDLHRQIPPQPDPHDPQGS